MLRTKSPGPRPRQPTRNQLTNTNSKGREQSRPFFVILTRRRCEHDHRRISSNGTTWESAHRAIYEDTIGFPPSTPAIERTPEERHASLEKFFAIMHSLSDEELNHNFMSDVRLAHKNDDQASAA